MKTAIVSAGNGNNEMIDNIFTLSRSNSDIYDGITGYLYFKILNLEPVEYFNLTEFEFQIPFNEFEKENCQRDFLNFKEKNNFSDKIKKDIEEISIYIRKKALEENVIKEIFKDKYIDASNIYGAKYIEQKIIKYYKER